MLRTSTLIAHVAFGLIAMTLSLPSMQDWPSQFATDKATVQLTFTAFLLSYGGLQLFFGPMSDRWGRRRMLLIGLGLALVGSACAALSNTIELLIFSRFIQGAGSAAGMVVGRALVNDLFQGPARTRIMAYIGMAMGVCPPAASLIGGKLHVVLGWQSNFIIIAILAVVLGVLTINILPKSNIGANTQNTDRDHWFKELLLAYRRLAGERQILLYVVLLCMTSATFYTFLGGAPLVLGNYGVKPDQLGWYIAVIPFSYIVGNYLTSRLAQQGGPQRVIWVGQSITVAGIVLMLALALAGYKSALHFALPLALVGFGHGLLIPPALAGMIGSKPALAGAAAAMAGLMQQVMGGIGGYLVGLPKESGPVYVGCIMLALTLMSIAATLALSPKERPDETSQK